MGSNGRSCRTRYALFALGAAATVHAQESTEASLEQVVVTAEKRTSTVQDTPASITAVSSQEIAARGLTDFNSLAVSVPGISMRSAGPGQTEFEMRGLTSSGGNTSQVGFYLDETPLSSPASAQVGKVVIDPSLYDLERVEVLRGPQGTLYGSSSMGGTVKVVPNAPQLNTVEGSAESKISHTDSGGSINNEVNAMLNLPIGSDAAFRFVGSSMHDAGWIYRNVIQDGAVKVDNGPGFPNVFRPANFYTAPLATQFAGANATTIDSVRASLLWKPIDGLSITPLLMWQRTNQNGSNTVDVAGEQQYPTLPPMNAHWEIYDTAEPQIDRFSLASLKLEYQLPGFSITSATALWSRDLVVSQDGTEENSSAINPGGNYDVAAGGIGPTGPNPYGPGVTEKDYTQQFTQELRATSTGEGPFQWLGGYFFQRLKSFWSMYSLNPQAAGIQNIYVDFQPQLIIQNALFGEASYKILPELKATVGVRAYHYGLDQSNKEYGLFTVFQSLGNSVPFNTAAGNSANGVDPKFDLSYNVAKDALLYLTISRGFRLGGVNQPIPVAPTGPGGAPVPPNTNTVLSGNECGLQQKLLLFTPAQCTPSSLLKAPATFDSDTVWNYEVGEKASFLDRQLEVNASVYYLQWLNPQVATNLAGFGITVNGADARTIGTEIETRARLPEGFEVSANLGYTNAEYTSNSAITGYPSGLKVPDVPEWTSALVLSSHHRYGDLRLIGSLEWDYVGTRTNAPYGETIALTNVNQSLLHLPAYELVNLRYGVHGEGWSATAFVTNLFNKETLLDPQPQINLQTGAFTRYLVNQPRTFGLDLSYSFGR